jgi:hypothetical protein
VSKAIRYLLLLIAIAWLVQDPSGAAHLVHQLMAWLSHAAQSLSAFASGL